MLNITGATAKLTDKLTAFFYFNNKMRRVSKCFIGYISNNIFPALLTEEEERHNLLRLSEGDESARNTLIEHNLRLVAHICRKFESTGIDKDDLISIGTIGLIKGVNTFRLGKGSRLSTYAARCIENEILMHLRSIKNSRTEVSLYESIGTDKEGNDITFMELLKNDGEEASEKVELAEEKELLLKNLDILSPKEKYVIRLRYGLHNDRSQTQREIAKFLGISRSYVSRIEKKAIDKLRERL